MGSVSQSTPVSAQATSPLDPVEEAMALVRAHGGRVTNARRRLVQVLVDRGEKEHMGAEDLAAQVQASLPDVHVSTIYRNLDELERLGVVVHTHVGHGPAVYHLAGHQHCHLVCEKCGATIEVPAALFATLRRRALTEFGFTVDARHSAVFGRCRACGSD